MTDKKKIRNIIELFIAWNGETEAIDVANLNSAVDFIADSLQEEPVSIWHDASEKPNIKEKSGIFVITLLNGEYIGSRYYNYDDVTINFGNYDKWAYLNDLINLSNVKRIGKKLERRICKRGLGRGGKKIF